MPTVLLGNNAPLDRGERLKGTAVTTVQVPDDATQAEVVAAITAGDGLWARHSEEAPAWVECAEDKDLADHLARVLDCPAKRPKTWA